MKKIIALLALSALAFTFADKPVKKNFRYSKTVESAYLNSNNLMNGHFERTYDNREVEAGNYINGKKDGLWISKTVSGLLIKKVNYKNDLLDGAVTLIYPDGKPRVTGTFKDGLKTGKWAFYNANGSVCKQGMYNDKGEATGIWTYYDTDGKKVVEKYDFDNKKMLEDNRATLHFNNNEETKVKNLYMDRNERLREVIDVPIPGARTLGGNRKTKEFFNLNFEIPQDVWFTYVAQSYFTVFKLSKGGALSNVQVSRIKGTGFNYTGAMDYYFFTEYPNKLQRVNPDERTLYHFADIIRENFEIFYGPWIVTSDKDLNAEVQMTFVVNQG